VAREHARISLGIWNDPDFQDLRPEEQRLYFLLLSQKTINNAGVLPLQVSKWAKGSKHTTVDDIEVALAGLRAGRFVLVDDDTEEVLVRSFVRNDGVAKHRYMLKNALSMARQVESPMLRRALAAELRRLGNPEADQVAAELDATPDRTPPERHSNSIPTPSEPQSNAQGEGEGEVSSSPPLPSESGSVLSRKPARRGTRIPEDFAPTDEMIAWAREHTPLVGQVATADFIDYWQGKTGKDATKLDWVATWRRWMRRAQADAERRQPRASPNGFASPTDANIANLLNNIQPPPSLKLLEGGTA
jgi:hypothetical protein